MRAAVILAILAGCTHSAVNPVPQIPLGQRISSYGGLPTAPLATRVHPAPPALVELLREQNAHDGLPLVPRAYQPTPEEAAAVQLALTSLPASVRRLVEPWVVGVFFSEDLGSSGFSDLVRDDAGRLSGGVVVLDRAALTRRANAWASWKEASPWRGAEGRVRLRLATDADDDVAHAVRFILLHEFGHLVGLLTHSHPEWNGQGLADGPFSSLSWVAARPAPKLREPRDFPPQGQLAFYASPEKQLDPARLHEIYAAIAASPFPTAYATTNLWDDFAESFASYVHVVLLGAPYEVSITLDDGRTETWPNGITDARCASRRAFVEGLLQP